MNAAADNGAAIAMRPPALHELYLRRAEISSSYDSALRDLNRSLRHKKTAEAYHLRACWHFEFNRYAQAARDLDSAIALGMRMPGLYARRAAALFNTMQFSAALRDLGRLERTGKKEDLTNLPLLRASALYCMGRFREAAKIHSALDPAAMSDALRIEALLSLRRGGGDAAYCRFVETVTALIDTSDSNDLQGTALRHLLGHEDADEKAVEFFGFHDFDKDDHWVSRRQAWYYLGEQQLWLGNRKKAAAYFRKSVKALGNPCDERVAAAAMLKLMQAGKV